MRNAATHESEITNATSTLSSSPDKKEQVSLLASAKTNLSLYVTSLVLDCPPGPEYDVTIMAAVKVQGDRGGEFGARADWVWEYWEKEWCFRQGTEVWGGS